MTKKEFKELTGTKCVVVSRVQVVSMKNDISFSLKLETQSVNSIELKRDFLLREPFQTNTAMGIVSSLVYNEAYDLISYKEGVSKLSKSDEESRYFSFYDKPSEENDQMYFNILFKKDETDKLLVNRISFSKAKKQLEMCSCLRGAKCVFSKILLCHIITFAPLNFEQL